MTKIFIVEDNVAIRAQLESFLTSYGYEVVATTQFDQIIDHIAREEPQLVLLDINLPIVDGYHVCRELRKQSDMPIIVVTSRDTEMDELMSINLGADDFVTKPYNTQILLARIESLLRRSARTNVSDVIEYNGLQFNSASSSVTYDGKTDELTKNEMKILNYLLKHQGKIVSRSDLMDYLWSTDVFVDVDLTPRIKRVELLEDERLADMLILRNPVNTNYLISEEHAALLQKLWDGPSVEDDLQAVEVENGHIEGKLQTYYGQRYERNAANRRMAIEIHGTTCQACGFDFEKVYGEHRNQ